MHTANFFHYGGCNGEQRGLYRNNVGKSRAGVESRIGRKELEAYDMTTKSEHHSLEIANRILDIADEKKIDVSIMKLHKLVFFAHCWHLAVYGTPLTSDSPEVWRYGPVYVAIQEEFGGSGIDAIKMRARIGAGGISPETTELLERVMKSLGNLDASTLTKMTHLEEAPWERTLAAGGYFVKIPDEFIKQYYHEKMGEIS